MVLIICCGVVSKPASTMTISGPITASSVNVSGSVTISSLSVTNLTVTNRLGGPGANLPANGKVLQVIGSSTTSELLTGSTTFVPVSGMSQSISLNNGSNYVRISVTGTLAVDDNACPGYLTVMKGTTTLSNLGDSSKGLTMAGGYPIQNRGPLYWPVGLSIADRPGDTSMHSYSVYIRSNCGANILFPANGWGFLLLEEINQ